VTKRLTYKSEALAAVHASAKAMQKIGAMDQTTMRQLEALCLTPTPLLQPQQIKRIRESAKVSQPVFARYLNTSESTVQKWETGVKQPSGMALKLLSVVQKHGLTVLT
jgi:putative transcriptional regulator